MFGVEKITITAFWRIFYDRLWATTSNSILPPEEVRITDSTLRGSTGSVCVPLNPSPLTGTPTIRYRTQE